MISYAQAFGGTAGGGNIATYWRAILNASKTFPPFSKNGRIRLTLVEPGGGGAKAGTSGFATGGVAGAWGRRSMRVNAGQVLTANLGAGGLGRTGINTATGDGLPGSPAFIQLDGVDVMRAPGAPGGKYSATSPATSPAPTTTIVGADFTVPGVPASQHTSAGGVGGGTGGATVDLLQTGAVPGINEGDGRGLGRATSGTAPLMPFTILEDFGFALMGSTAGMPGVGGANSQSGTAGPLAGGGGNTTGSGTAGGNGGLGGGGGGGAGAGNAGNGGQAWGTVEYIADED